MAPLWGPSCSILGVELHLVSLLLLLLFCDYTAIVLPCISLNPSLQGPQPRNSQEVEAN